MTRRIASWLSFLAAGAALCCSYAAVAQQQTAPDSIADNDSIFIDGTTFRLIPGKAKSDGASLVKALAARELGAGAIVFRSGEKLYVVDVPLVLPESISPDGRRVFVDGKKHQSNRVRVEYVPPKNPDHQAIYELLKARGALELVQKLYSPLRLPAELTITSIGCDGVVNAWYEVKNSRPTVSICYEYLASIAKYAPTATTPAGVTRADAIVGQFLFVVSHEIGHALFEMFEIGLFGREEDAADQFAAYFILHLGEDRARALVGGAAYAYRGFFADFEKNPKVAVPLESFSSTHGAPESRFYNLLCTAYGANPELFADIVQNKHLPETRAKNCKYEFKVLTHAMRREILPYVDTQLAAQFWDLPSSVKASTLTPPAAIASGAK